MLAVVTGNAVTAHPELRFCMAKVPLICKVHLETSRRGVDAQ